MLCQEGIDALQRKQQVYSLVETLAAKYHWLRGCDDYDSMIPPRKKTNLTVETPITNLSLREKPGVCFQVWVFH